MLGRLPCPALLAQGPLRRAARLPCGAEKKGFGKQTPPRAPPKKRKAKRPVKDALEDLGQRWGDVDATRDAHALLHEFGAAQDRDALAIRERHRLSQQFFALVDWFLKKAKSSGNVKVALDMKGILTAATRVKGATLRPELELVNRLMMASTTAEARREALATPESLQTLRHNDSYVLLLLDQMLEDAASNRYSSEADRAAVIQQLHETRADCVARLQQGEAQDAAAQQQQAAQAGLAAAPGP